MKRYSLLLKYIERSDSAIVAFSGGVDSSLVAKAAHDVLGDDSLAVTAVSATLPERERSAAHVTAAEIGIKHLELAVDELSDPLFAKNEKNRCYRCKVLRMGALLGLAERLHFETVLDGANIDDLDDYRPGMAAGRELGVISPLIEVGIGKAEARSLLKRFALSINDKPSSPCLASRFPYGERITAEKLSRVERAEEICLSAGVSDVRVRHHGRVARIEVPTADFPKILDRVGLAAEIRSLGFNFAALELEGLKSGCLSRSWDEEK